MGLVGEAVGGRTGTFVGANVGIFVGAMVGGRIGTAVGATVGERTGDTLGVLEGATVGTLEGDLVGDLEGVGEGSGSQLSQFSVTIAADTSLLSSEILDNKSDCVESDTSVTVAVSFNEPETPMNPLNNTTRSSTKIGFIRAMKN